MGQARQRGTFEQRQTEGIAKRHEQERKRAEQLKERDRSRRDGLLLTLVLGTIATSSIKRPSHE